MRAIMGVFAGLGVAGILAFWGLVILGVIGWFMNIYKLIANSPELAAWGLEQVIRIIGLYPIVGAVVGWF